MGIVDKIIRPEGITLWATRYGYFDDEKEYIWPFEKIQPHLKRLAKDMKVEYDDTHQVYPYILSFTNDIYSKYMWENYGADGHGVELIFDRIKLYEYCNKCMLDKCKAQYCADVRYYSESTFGECIESAYNDLQHNFANIDPIQPLYEVPAFLKDKEQFEEEKEFRIVRCLNEIFCISAKDPNIYVVAEEKPHDLVPDDENDKNKTPRIKMIIPNEALVGVCLSNKSYTKDNIKHLKNLLYKGNYKADIYQTEEIL